MMFLLLESKLLFMLSIILKILLLLFGVESSIFFVLFMRCCDVFLWFRNNLVDLIMIFIFSFFYGMFVGLVNWVNWIVFLFLKLMWFFVVVNLCFNLWWIELYFSKWVSVWIGVRLFIIIMLMLGLLRVRCVK